MLGHRDQLIERIDRRVERQKTLQHGSKQEYSAAGILLFIKDDSRFNPANKPRPNARSGLAHHMLAEHLFYPLNLFLRVSRIPEIVELQYLAQGFGAPALIGLDQRKR